MISASPIRHASGLIGQPVIPAHRRSIFTLKNVVVNACIITILVFINKAGLPGNVLFFGIAGCLAMRSSEGALKALSLVMLALITNLYFVEKSGLIWVAGRFCILFICAGRFFYDLSKSRHSLMARVYFRFFLGFVFICVLLSFINNYYLTVSLLKLLSFGVGVSAIFAGLEVSRTRNSEISAWFYGIILFTVGLGFLALLIGQGYNVKASSGIYNPSDFYFNGPFYHSNTLGPIAALMMIYMIAIYVFSPYKLRWLSVILILSLAYFIFLTKSRTSMGTVAIATTSMLIFATIAQQRGRAQVRFNIPKVQIFLYGVIALFLVFFADFFTGGDIRSKFIQMINKGDSSFGQSGLDVQQILSSRMFLYEIAVENFKQRPLTGISFGTATTADFAATATWLSAPTEKGNIFFGMLEEVGLIGSFAFWLFVISFVIYLIRDLNVSGFGMFVAMLSINMGEMMFFSFGGHGAMAWVLLGGGLALGDRCLTRQ